MSIRDLIFKIKEEWPEYRLKRVTNNKATLYQNVVLNFPKLLQNLAPHKDLYKFVGSTGRGNVTAAPWVATLYKKLTDTPTKEYYLVYLFSSDMKLLYLSIAFGVTEFKRKFKNSMYEKMREGAKTLQDVHPAPFIKKELDLRTAKNERLHFGYQKSNIYALEYQLSNLPEEERLIKDYLELLEHYRAMATNEMIISMEEMVEEIANPNPLPFQFSTPQLLEASESPLAFKSRKSKKNPRNQKRQSKESKKVGDRGEMFVLENERAELRRANRPDLAKKVELVASKNCGWDVTSFDSTGKVKYIEVKSSSKKKINSIDITVNEWNQAINPKRAQNYYIYLVTNALSEKPQVNYVPVPADWIKKKKAEIFPVVFRIEF